MDNGGAHRSRVRAALRIEQAAVTLQGTAAQGSRSVRADGRGKGRHGFDRDRNRPARAMRIRLAGLHVLPHRPPEGEGQPVSKIDSGGRFGVR